jgi:hypothetical protein
VLKDAQDVTLTQSNITSTGLFVSNSFTTSATNSQLTIKHNGATKDLGINFVESLPAGTYNKSMTFRAFNGGKLYQIGSDPDKDREISRAGAEASNATQARRRSLKDELLVALSLKDKETGATKQERITIAQIERAEMGDTKAFLAIRDTIGEKPADTVDLNANVMTEADKTLIEKLKKRTGIEE